MVDCAPARRASSPSWLGSDSDSFRRADRKEMELPAAAATEQGSQDDDRYQIPLFGKTKTNKSAEDQEKKVVCHSDSDWQSRDRDIVSSGVFHANLLRSASHNSYNHPRAVPRVY